MERTTVQSTNLLEIGYDPTTETLEVMFKNGGIYQYYNLPQHMYDQLMQAQSHGIFFNSQIKGHYPEARM